MNPVKTFLSASAFLLGGLTLAAVAWGEEGGASPRSWLQFPMGLEGKWECRNGAFEYDGKPRGTVHWVEAGPEVIRFELGKPVPGATPGTTVLPGTYAYKLGNGSAIEGSSQSETLLEHQHLRVESYGGTLAPKRWTEFDTLQQSCPKFGVELDANYSFPFSPDQPAISAKLVALERIEFGHSARTRVTRKWVSCVARGTYYSAIGHSATGEGRPVYFTCRPKK